MQEELCFGARHGAADGTLRLASRNLNISIETEFGIKISKSCR